MAAYNKALQFYGADHLFAHLMLASTYGVTGRQAEAQAEAAEVLRIDPTFSLEAFARRIAYKDQEVADDIVSALRKAGLR